MAESQAEQSTLMSALRCKCPRCGQGALFKGFLTVRETCQVCGLDLSQEDSGDGPQSFIILIVGVIVVGGVFWMEMSFQPPPWLHAIIWIPVTLVLSIAILRPLKSLMIAQQYKHRSGEGHRVD